MSERRSTEDKVLAIVTTTVDLPMAAFDSETMVARLTALIERERKEAIAGLQPPGVRLVRIHEEYVGMMGARTADGTRALSYQFSDPDENGISVMLVTATEDGGPPELKAERDRLRGAGDALIKGIGSWADAKYGAEWRAVVAAYREATK